MKRMYKIIMRSYSTIALTSAFAAMTMIFDIQGWIKILAIIGTIVVTTCCILASAFVEYLVKTNARFRDLLDEYDNRCY